MYLRAIVRMVEKVMNISSWSLDSNNICYNQNLVSIRINNYTVWDVTRIISNLCFFSGISIDVINTCVAGCAGHLLTRRYSYSIYTPGSRRTWHACRPRNVHRPNYHRICLYFRPKHSPTIWMNFWPGCVFVVWCGRFKIIRLKTTFVAFQSGVRAIIKNWARSTASKSLSKRTVHFTKSVDYTTTVGTVIIIFLDIWLPNWILSCNNCSRKIRVNRFIWFGYV